MAIVLTKRFQHDVPAVLVRVMISLCRYANLCEHIPGFGRLRKQWISSGNELFNPVKSIVAQSRKSLGGAVDE